MKTSHLIPLLAALSLSSCDKKVVSTDGAEILNSQNSALSTYFVDEAPADAIQISEARKNPEVGKKITVFGEVMGRTDPIAQGSALVTLGDPTQLTPCNRNPDDECETPWDNCCDTNIKENIATIQLVDASGRPLKESMRGVHGLKELSYLIVTGTIAEGSNEKNLIINADKIHVAVESPYKDAPPVTANLNNKSAETDSSQPWNVPLKGEGDVALKGALNQ